MNKLFTLFVTILALLAVVVRPSAIEVARRELKQHSSCLLPTPNTQYADVSTCNGLWHREGTVCNKDKLTILSNGDKQSIGKAQDHFKELLQLLKAVILIGKGHVSFKGIQFNSQALVKAINDTEIQTMEIASAKCWNKMASIRSSSLCSVCSATNAKYFLGSLAAISKRACDSVMTACAEHFRQLALLGSTFQSLMPAYMRLNIEFMTKNKALQIFKVYGQLHNLLWNYVHEEDKAEKQMKKVKICQKTIKLVEAPFIHPLILITKEFLDHFKSHLSHEMSRMLDSNWGQIQLATYSNILSGDVVVLKQTDNMFTSFLGANVHESAMIRPMNLSLAFP